MRSDYISTPFKTFLIFELISAVIPSCSSELLFIRLKHKLKRKRRDQFLCRCWAGSLMNRNTLYNMHGVCIPNPFNFSLVMIYSFKS